MKTTFKAILLFTIFFLSIVYFLPVKAAHPDCQPPFTNLIGTYTSISTCEYQLGVVKDLIGYCCYESPTDGTVYGYGSCKWGKECQIGEEIGTCNPRGDCILPDDCDPYWNCGDWLPLTSEKPCGSTFTQTRVCIDLYECDTQAGKPSEERSATGTYCPTGQICQAGNCVAGSSGESTPPPTQSGYTGGGITIQNPLNVDNFPDLLDALINFIFWVGITLAPIMLIVAGLIFVTSSGSPERVTTARRFMIWTLIGLAVLLLAKGLVAVITSILGG